MPIRIDHAKPESKFQAEQVQWVFRGQQALSCDDANIVVIKANPGALTHAPCILFWIFDLCSIMIVHKSIEVVWYCSCIKIDLPVRPC
jgi:hypothetical protein